MTVFYPSMTGRTMYISRRLTLFFHNLPGFIHEDYHVWGEDASNMTNIPLQHRVTMQILKHCQTFRDLKLTYEVSRRVETSLPSHTVTHRDNCRRFCPSDRDGQPIVSRGGCPQTCTLVQVNESVGTNRHIVEMSHGLLAFGSPFLPLVSVQQFRP
jgi:hypothetical protein